MHPQAFQCRGTFFVFDWLRNDFRPSAHDRDQKQNDISHPSTLLTARAESKKFELVCDGLETVAFGNALFKRLGETFLDLDHVRAARAHEMMVMAVVAFGEQLEARDTVAEFEPLHH